ncbi:hypothetical protein ELX58_07365 [Acetilactobacillus jinshanensis]|uniref:Peptidase C39-like domain-containing protein n=1 Tax=Acetilactobacillus jinshanensis TaxID=1720083 RepID=A0A4P6ZM87_9LACO|nr:hypothetical protein ELX58_07365 [Acetilactobacillus jinshanensis]
MKLKTTLLIIISCLVLSFVNLQTPVRSSSSNEIRTVKITRLHHAKLKMIRQKGWSVYNRPFSLHSKAVLNTRQLHGQLVKPTTKATHDHQIYYRIIHRSRVYGWVNARCLATPRQYILPYQYYSQLYPLWAPEACEATSLKIGLSAKGLANDVGLMYIVDHMPESSNSNKGFSGNPYKDNSGFYYWWNLIKHGFNSIFSQTIYPKPLAKYARHYDPDARNITDAKKAKLIQEVKHGNPVVFVGSFQMIDTNSSYHILTLVGYKKGHFLVADPYRYLGQRHRIFWVKTTRFMKIFDNQLRGRRAVAL